MTFDEYAQKARDLLDEYPLIKASVQRPDGKVGVRYPWEAAKYRADCKEFNQRLNQLMKEFGL